MLVCDPPDSGDSGDDPSRRAAGNAHGRTLESTIEMAYWLAPGTSYPTAGRSHQDFRDTLVNRVTIALTAYMPPEFSEFLAYDPAKRAFVPLSDGPGEQSLPIEGRYHYHCYVAIGTLEDVRRTMARLHSMG